MGLGTTPRPHLTTWDYGAEYRPSGRYVANTMHFPSSVSRQALNRSRIAPSGPHLAPQTPAIPPESTLIDTICPSRPAPPPTRCPRTRRARATISPSNANAATAEIPTETPTRPNRIAGISECRYVSKYDSAHPEVRTDLDKLLGAVARGEFGAFDLVYEQLREPIHNQVRAVLRDTAQSEEVTQEVLLELWRTAIRYNSAKGSASAWAMTIARRRAIDRVRRTEASTAREQRVAMSDVQASQASQADETVANTIDRERLLRCVDQLSDLQREAIKLAFYGDHTYSEVAGILGVPLGTVKARIRDAIIKLRDAMLSEAQDEN
jgi:RNA polymerase sigma-70 factor, ECF subfamily